MDPIELFVRNIARTRYDDLPAQAIQAAKTEILDLLAVTLGGSSASGVEELRQLFTDWGGKSEATVMGWGDQLASFHAAQLNATMAHALDFDDVHDRAVMHPGVVIIPTILAIAERQGGISGKEFITNVVLGVDMMCRFGLAIVPHSGNRMDTGWHHTTVCGFLAAAAIAGRLLGFTETQLVDAIGIGYHQASGNGQCVLDGSLTKRMGPGFAARGGIVAALMAEKGITGAKNSLAGKYGLFNQYYRGGYDDQVLIKDLGKHFEGVNVSIKPYPCCRGVHAAIDATLDLVSRHHLQSSDVKTITIHTGTGNYNLLCLPTEVKCQPRNAVDSQFSIPWGVAVAIARGRVTMSDFTQEAIRDPAILAISGKIRVELNNEFNRQAGVEPARVTITTKNGEEHTAEVEHPLGSPEKPITWESLAIKFRDCSSNGIGHLPEDNIAKLIDLVGHLEEVENTRELMMLTRWEKSGIIATAD
jgi:2-methylcitrate dehydratase PrpD